MKVILAGYNIDTEVINELAKSCPPRLDITPETLSAAYARISRDPRPVDELRADARHEVERARRSNQTIIFRMGHHSVAEHAVFNFDILGVSRLAIEGIEHFRLASYTEKSQRYVKIGEGVVIPEEIKSAGKEKEFISLARRQHELYEVLYAKLRPYFLSKYQDLSAEPKNQIILDNWAKEDARYVLSLATPSQLGMTVNARTLELMIRRFTAAPLAELRLLGQELYDSARRIAPSLLLFTAASRYEVRTSEELKSGVEMAPKKNVTLDQETKQKPVKLITMTPGGDDFLLAALLHPISGRSFEATEKWVKKLSPGGKRRLWRVSFQHLEFYDRLLREFEHVDFTFELVVSAACFAQLKRHRLATITSQPYDPSLGVIIPPSIKAVGGQKDFLALMRQCELLYRQLRPRIGEAAAYVLTNAHRRRVLFKANVRELYHVSRLREDASAQWDIRKIVTEITKQAKKRMPLAFLLIGGKDAFPRIYEKVFARPPESLPPTLFKPVKLQ